MESQESAVHADQREHRDSLGDDYGLAAPRGQTEATGRGDAPLRLIADGALLFRTLPVKLRLDAVEVVLHADSLPHPVPTVKG